MRIKIKHVSQKGKSKQTISTVVPSDFEIENHRDFEDGKSNHISKQNKVFEKRKKKVRYRPKTALKKPANVC